MGCRSHARTAQSPRDGGDPQRPGVVEDGQSTVVLLCIVRRRQLPRRQLSRTLEGMEIHFTPEQERQLAQIADHAGTDAEGLVKQAALRLLEEDDRFRAAVREGIAQVDRGELIEDEEVRAMLEEMLRS